MNITLPSVEFAIAIWVVVGILTLIVHIGFAQGVWGAAKWLEEHPSRDIEMAQPMIWTLATLLGGVFVAAAFWILHFSTLSPHGRKFRD